MTHCIAVFRSKNQLFIFQQDMQRLGINVTIVGTPKEAKIGCGISAQFDIGYFNYAVNLIEYNRYDSFYGIYKVTRVGIKTTTQKLYPL